MNREQQSETTYEYENFLKDGIKFTAYRETLVNAESLVHKHNFIEILYIISGNAVHYVDGIPYNVTKGDLLLIDTDQTHYFRAEVGCYYANMILLPDFISENLHSDHTALDVFAYCLYNSENGDASQPRSPLIRFRGSDLIAADSIVNAMCDEVLNKRDHYTEIVSNYLSILFHMMIRSIEEGTNHRIMHDIRSVIPSIIDYIEHNCGSQITMSDVAGKYFYSPSYFSRAFKKYFGVTFSAYLQNVRVRKVIRLMEETTLTVEEISESTGYRDRRELYRAFKNVTGTTPGNYRRNKTDAPFS